VREKLVVVLLGVREVNEKERLTDIVSISIGLFQYV
jgi:hypothetical protein